MKKEKNANYLRNIARYTLLIVGVLMFIFALLSGSSNLGGGITGVLKNSPNALPWLIFLFFLSIAWKWEFVGGIIIMLVGFGSIYLFTFYTPHFHWATFILSLVITMLGFFFILSWNLRRNINNT